MRFYAVAKGRETGIFHNWKDCKRQVHRYEGAMFKSFDKKEEAKTFIDNEKQKRIYLYVYYSKKNIVKSLGGHWDTGRKMWFIYENNQYKDTILKKFKQVIHLTNQ